MCGYVLKPAVWGGGREPTMLCTQPKLPHAAPTTRVPNCFIYGLLHRCMVNFAYSTTEKTRLSLDMAISVETV